MNKQITHKEDMLKSIETGIDSIASIVARTLGPGGLPILIQRQGQALNGDLLGPLITKDGVTVAAECASEDENEDLVIQAVKAICQKTNRVAGDGTTTAIVLGQALLKESIKKIQQTGMNPQALRREIEEAAGELEKTLSDKAMPCESSEMLEHVATISANGDKEIGQIIRNAFDAVGVDGVVTVDEGGGKNHTLEVVNGFQIRRGAEAQDRFFNNDQKTKFEADEAYVILYDGKINSANQLVPAFQLLAKEFGQKFPPLLVIANDFSLDTIQMLLTNKAHAGLSLCAIKSPHQTKVTTAMLDDLAVFLGGARLGNGEKTLDLIDIDDFGIVKKVVVDKYSTTLFDGYGSEECVMERVEQLQAQRDMAESDYDAALISDRISSLNEGIAKIGVGGLTDLEVKEKYHRIEDAVNAARAAVEQGIVPGGGTMLYRLSDDVKGSNGAEVLKKALRAPLEQILTNLGKNVTELDLLIPKILKNDNTVYDGNTGEITDFLKSGIVDPVKVTKTALSNAISIASLLSTCGGAITFKRKR